MKTGILVALLIGLPAHAGCEDEYRAAIRKNLAEGVPSFALGMGGGVVSFGVGMTLATSGRVGIGIVSMAIGILGIREYAEGTVLLADADDLREARTLIRAGYAGEGRRIEMFTEYLRKLLKLKLEVEEVASAIVQLDQADAFCRDETPVGIRQVYEQVILVLKPDFEG